MIPYYQQYRKPGILLALSKFLINPRIGYCFCDNCIIELTESQGIKDLGRTMLGAQVPR